MGSQGELPGGDAHLTVINSGVYQAMTFSPPARLDAVQHVAWCRQHTPEGCLSAEIQIPDLPFAVWATTVQDHPDTIRVVVDTSGPDGAVVIDVRAPTD